MDQVIMGRGGGQGPLSDPDHRENNLGLADAPPDDLPVHMDMLKYDR